MSKVFFVLLVFFTACTVPEKRKANHLAPGEDTTRLQANDANTAVSDTANLISLPAVQKIKSPTGIYYAVLPQNRVEQTIAFNGDLTYQLQEKYLKGEKDSTVVTEGTWMPSDGFVWLYKDQIVRGRYKWKGDTLQYYNPVMKKSFSMRHLQDALHSAALQHLNSEGLVLFGTGNEPSWGLKLTNKDSVSFSPPSRQDPLKLKIDSSFSNQDSSGYVAGNDSTKLFVTIFPHFCTSGNYVFRNRLRVQYNHQVYGGCGILFK